jgi:hypothetical protein
MRRGCVAGYSKIFPRLTAFAIGSCPATQNPEMPVNDLKERSLNRGPLVKYFWCEQLVELVAGLEARERWRGSKLSSMRGVS